MGQEQVIEDGDLNKEYADLEPEAAEILTSGTLDETPEKAEDDDTKEYNAKIQRRIGKEVSRRKREVKAAEQEANVFRSDAAAARRELAEFKVQAAKAEREKLEARQKELQTDMKSALEDGETERYVNQNDEYLKSTVRLSKIDDEEASYKRQEEESSAYIEKQKQAQEQPSVAAEAQTWYEDNQDWIAKDPEKFNLAKEISVELVNSGKYSTTDQELYDEIDRRLQQSPSPAGVPPVVSVPGNATPAPAQSVGGRLTTEDIRNMKRYGLDPDNVQARADYKKYKDGGL